jgi:hypothetical protein
MKDWIERFSPRTAMAAAVLGGAVVMTLTLPSKGQQSPQQPQPTPGVEAPVVRAIVPMAPEKGRRTRIGFDLSLPLGGQVVSQLRVRSDDAMGRPMELLPMRTTRGSSPLQGYGYLNTGAYPPGVYQISVEAEYALPGGRRGTVRSPVVSLAIGSNGA